MKAQGIALGLTRKTVASPRREVNQFPSGAGYAGPGFHTWPSGHVLQDTDPNPLLRSRSPTKKSFGEAFGAATGVSDPRLQKKKKPCPQATGPGLPSAGDHDSTYTFFLTRRRGERGGRKIGFSPRAPRLRVNRGFACSKDVRRSVRRGVRRRNRGQRPTATEEKKPSAQRHPSAPIGEAAGRSASTRRRDAIK